MISILPKPLHWRRPYNYLKLLQVNTECLKIILQVSQEASFPEISYSDPTFDFWNHIYSYIHILYTYFSIFTAPLLGSVFLYLILSTMTNNSYQGSTLPTDGTWKSFLLWITQLLPTWAYIQPAYNQVFHCQYFSEIVRNKSVHLILMCTLIFKNQNEVPWDSVALPNWEFFKHILWLSPLLNHTDKSHLSDSKFCISDLM